MFLEQSKQKCDRKSRKIKDPGHEQKSFSGAVGGRPIESSLSYSSACTSRQSFNHWDQIQTPCHRYLFSYLESLKSERLPQGTTAVLALAKWIPRLLSEKVASRFKKKRLRNMNSDEWPENSRAASWILAPVAAYHCLGLLYSSLRTRGLLTLKAESPYSNYYLLRLVATSKHEHSFCL